MVVVVTRRTCNAKMRVRFLLAALYAKRFIVRLEDRFLRLPVKQEPVGSNPTLTAC